LANRDTPMGIRVLRNANGDFPPVRKYTAGATVIFEGQLVRLRSDGTVVGATGTYLNTSAALDILGVAAHYKAASASPSEVLVHLDKGMGQEYVVQADDNSVTTIAVVGENCAVLNASLGSTATGQSQAELDFSSHAASATPATGLHLKIVEVSKEVGNALGSSWCDFVVQINRRVLHLAKDAGV
jgi:hypothetical protein